MTTIYDRLYESENLFGEAHQPLLDWFIANDRATHVLDLGCGQGRNAIPLAKLGYHVTAIDISKTGIEQLNLTAKRNNVQVDGRVGDIYSKMDLTPFDHIILDSMLHFTKKDEKKEKGLVTDIIHLMKGGGHLILCVPDNQRILKAVNDILTNVNKYVLNRKDEIFSYSFKDPDTGHTSVTPYRMIIMEKAT